MGQKTGCCSIQPAITRFIARIPSWENLAWSHGRNERLEPYVEKSTSTVLRGGDGGNAIPLTRPFRRGYRFGTLLVNLESHRVVDLLPDRRAETATQWIRQQPDGMVVSRDRGGEYASAASAGAPQAIQCADRFHILKNLTEAVQVLLARCQAEILTSSNGEDAQQNATGQPIISLEEWRPPEPAHVEKVRLARRAGRHARSQQVVTLQQQGMKPQDIAPQLGLSERTVRRWLAGGAFPEAKKRRKRQSSFDEFAPYVLKCWQNGERNGLALWREIKAASVTLGQRGASTATWKP